MLAVEPRQTGRKQCVKEAGPNAVSPFLQYRDSKHAFQLCLSPTAETSRPATNHNPLLELIDSGLNAIYTTNHGGRGHAKQIKGLKHMQNACNIDSTVSTGPTKFLAALCGHYVEQEGLPHGSHIAGTQLQPLTHCLQPLTHCPLCPWQMK